MDMNAMQLAAAEVVRCLDPFSTGTRTQLPEAISNLAMQVGLPVASQLAGESHGTVALLIVARFIQQYGGLIDELHTAHNELHRP